MPSPAIEMLCPTQSRRNSRCRSVRSIRPRIGRGNPLLILRGWPKTGSTSSATSGGRCPTRPASTCSRTRDGRVLYVGKAKSIRKRVGSHFSGKTARGSLEFLSTGRLDRLRRDRQRGRGAARRAALHQAAPAAVQHPAARRQVVPVHRHLAGRAVPARVLHARAPPDRARLLRSVLERQARARDARPARPAVPVPHVRRARAGPRCPAAPASTTTSSAARRPASTTSARRTTAPTSTRSCASCRATTARSSASSSSG